jgi:toxin ParE1/3/4
MPNYEISFLADEDLENIARYTIRTWDIEQAEKYMALLDKHFEELGTDKVRTRVFIKHRKELKVSRCQKHVVFHLGRIDSVPLILAVLHESMDLMERLKGRL